MRLGLFSTLSLFVWMIFLVQSKTICCVHIGDEVSEEVKAFLNELLHNHRKVLEKAEAGLL